MAAIIRKELSDYFNSVRFIVLLMLVLLVSVATFYNVQQMWGSGSGDFIFLRLFTTGKGIIPSFVGFMALYFIPLVGIALGFDAINSERSAKTLSRLISQPIYRDSIINGKFLAGLMVLTIMVFAAVLLVVGYGLMLFDLRDIGFNVIGVGVPLPSAEEIIRVFIYIVLAVFYGAFWMGLAILFSVVFRRVAASLLLAIVIWLFFSQFFWGNLIAPNIANAISPVGGGSDIEVIKNAVVEMNVQRFSPSYLFGQATEILLNPIMGSFLGIVGAIASGQSAVPLLNALSLGQSLYTVWPHLVSLVSLSVICFAVSYVVFMRQEIRSV